MTPAKAGLNTIEDVFQGGVKDLAGVRIATYEEHDRSRVAEEIKSLFNGPEGPGTPVEAEEKDGQTTDHRATHCQVTLREDDLVGTNENLAGTACEIQVCSLLAHVRNEIEHDIRYKPLQGQPSPAENDMLEALANMTRAGDLAIKRLLEANSERLVANEGAFQDEFDFVARTRNKFPAATDFGRHSPQLFEELDALEINTPQLIDDRLLDAEGHQRRANDLLTELIYHVRSSAGVDPGLDHRSSDVLLVLLLDKYVDAVLTRHPMGRGKGRPPRIASAAKRFKEMKDGWKGRGT